MCFLLTIGVRVEDERLTRKLSWLYICLHRILIMLLQCCRSLLLPGRKACHLNALLKPWQDPQSRRQHSSSRPKAPALQRPLPHSTSRLPPGAERLTVRPRQQRLCRRSENSLAMLPWRALRGRRQAVRKRRRRFRSTGGMSSRQPTGRRVPWLGGRFLQAWHLDSCTRLDRQVPPPSSITQPVLLTSRLAIST